MREKPASQHTMTPLKKNNTLIVQGKKQMLHKSTNFCLRKHIAVQTRALSLMCSPHAPTRNRKLSLLTVPCLPRKPSFAVFDSSTIVSRSLPPSGLSATRCEYFSNDARSFSERLRVSRRRHDSPAILDFRSTGQVQLLFFQKRIALNWHSVASSTRRHKEGWILQHGDPGESAAIPTGFTDHLPLDPPGSQRSFAALMLTDQPEGMGRWVSGSMQRG